MSEKVWRLFGYEITDSEDNPEEFSWTRWKLDEDGQLEAISGPARIEGRFLVMWPWKAGGLDRRFNNLAEVEEHLDTFPKWNRTSYCERKEDGGPSVFFDCTTGECITDIGDIDMPKQG